MLRLGGFGSQPERIELRLEWPLPNFPPATLGKWEFWLFLMQLAASLAARPKLMPPLPLTLALAPSTGTQRRVWRLRFAKRSPLQRSMCPAREPRACKRKADQRPKPLRSRGWGFSFSGVSLSAHLTVTCQHCHLSPEPGVSMGSVA